MFNRFNKLLIHEAAALGVLIVTAQTAMALVEPEQPLPPALKTVVVPEPANLSDFVKDKAAAIALGKALFWDTQVGSDGLACASCHFHAGADNRIKNQLSPGLKNVAGAPLSEQFNLTASNAANANPPPAGGGPNYVLKFDDFPYHQLADPEDRNSEVLFDTDDVTSSQGAFSRVFDDLMRPGKRREKCKNKPSFFSVGGVNVRQVEPRNTPTVINAIYNFRNFWDGRANNIFNGMDPFGVRHAYNPNDPNNIYILDTASGNLIPTPVAIANASLASQAVGPALSDFEMSCAGRVFPQVGKKLLSLRPLGKQKVDKSDSVLGSYAAPAKGLKPQYSYQSLIKQAFDPKYWDSAQQVNGYSLMENNFSLFWGLAIQLYEATLVSDQTPFDKYRENATANPLTDEQVRGFNVFAGKGRCIVCHRGAEFTAASADHVQENYVERMLMGNAAIGLYDTGFYNIGVRPSKEDLGLGASDPYGNPLSYARLAKKNTDGFTPWVDINPDPFTVDADLFLHQTDTPVSPTERDVVDGTFKTPTLRNVELTGPYFHNGGQATLDQVVMFYERGGDSRILPDGSDTSGYGNNSSNVDSDLAGQIDPLETGGVPQNLGLTPEERSDLVAFLKALTDERVRWEQAPFDHPSLAIPNGHPGDESWVESKGSKGKAAKDIVTDLPTVGAAGRQAKGLPALNSFDAGLQ